MEMTQVLPGQREVGSDPPHFSLSAKSLHYINIKYSRKTFSSAPTFLRQDDEV